MFTWLGHPRPSMFLGLCDLKRVWLVLEYFSTTSGLIRINRRASNRNKIMLEMCVQKGLISTVWYRKWSLCEEGGCSRFAHFGCENKHPRGWNVAHPFYYYIFKSIFLEFVQANIRTHDNSIKAGNIRRASYFLCLKSNGLENEYCGIHGTRGAHRDIMKVKWKRKCEWTDKRAQPCCVPFSSTRQRVSFSTMLSFKTTSIC